MGSETVITPEDVLESLMNDGTIDSLRLKIINQLKSNEELKKTTIKMAEQSKVLNTAGAEKQTKRELFDALRQELETQVLEKASKSVWELILDNNGMGKEINTTVERVFCKLSGREPPLFPPPNEDTNTKANADANASAKVNANSNAKAKGNVKGKGKGKVKGKEKAKEKEAAVEQKEEKEKSNLKKRSYSEVNAQGDGEVAVEGKVEEQNVEVKPKKEEEAAAPVPMAEDPKV